MKTKVFAIFDSKVGAYMQPFFMPSAGSAIRAWGTTVNDKTTTFCTHPADFTLFEIGEYDETNGCIQGYNSYVNLGTALEHKHRPEPNVEMFPSGASVQPLKAPQLEESVNARGATQ